MALVLKDRVRETTTTTGTGTITLAGAVTGFQTFTSVLSNSDETYYCITDGANFEVGKGTFTSSGTTLARDTVLESSNSGNKVDWGAGTRDVFITQPAEKAVYLDSSGNIDTANGSNLTNLNASNLGSGTVPNARLDAQLQDVAALAVTDGGFIVGDGSNFVLETGATARTSIGVGSIATQAADSVNIDGGAIDAVTLGTNSAVTEAQIDNININGNAITSTDTNGNIGITPNGTGDVQLNADTVRVGDSNANATITTSGTGDLTLNTNSGTDSGSIVIADAANGDITITPNGTGSVVIDGLNYPQADGSAGQFLKTDGSAGLSFATVSTDLVDDTSPQLGGNLDTNSHNILIDTAHFIGDENGNEQIAFVTTASAVNHITVTNAATGNDPYIVATGNDTNIDLGLSGKGTGGVAVFGTMYATGNIGLDSTDYISFTNNTQMDVYLNGNNEFRFEADGDFHADGDVVAFSTTVSDERLKSDIAKIDGAVDKLEQLNGYTFTYTADGKQSAGVIAQEVEKILPSAVSEKELPLKTDDGIAYKTVQYDQLHALLIEAVKELSARVKELEDVSRN